MKIIKNLCLSLLALLIFSQPTMALGPKVEELFSAGNNLVRTGLVEGSVFDAGRNLKSDAIVRGIMFTAGENLLLEGESEYLFAAGKMLNVAQKVDRDLFAAGQILNFDQVNIGRDAYMAGEDIVLDGNVGRNLFIGAKSASLSGNVKGDLTLGVEKVDIADDMVIGGNLKYNEDAQLNMSDKVKVGGEKTTYKSEEFKKEEPTEREKIVAKLGGYLIKLATAVMYGLILLWLFPGIFINLVKQNLPLSAASFWKKIGTGLLVLILTPLVALFIFITIVGIPVSLLLLMVYGFAIFTAQIFVGYLLGTVLLSKSKKWLNLVLGVSALILIKMLPLFGGVITWLSIIWGLGIQYRLMFPKKA